jgi:hypothetical protein
MDMTERSFEYKALRFLNDRFELYNITDHCLKIALYDFPESDYILGINSLRTAGYIKNKELNEKGLSITTQGQVKLQQLQKIVENEKRQAKSFWEKTSPIRDAIGTLGIIAGIIFAWLKFSNDQQIADLKTEVKSLNDSVSLYRKENRNLRDSNFAPSLEINKEVGQADRSKVTKQ